MLIEDVIDGDGLVAGRAVPAEADSNAGSLTVWAPLFAEVALLAVGAGVDGDVATAPGGGEDDRVGW